MKVFAWFILAAIAVAISGCAEMVSITTVDEIHASQNQLVMASDRPANDVNNCLKDVIVNYRNELNQSPYANATFRDFEKGHDITLRRNYSSSLAGPEIMFLIKISDSATNGSTSHVWINQMLLFSDTYKNKLENVIKPCMTSKNVQQQITSNDGATTSQSSVIAQKLRELQQLKKDGLINDQDYELKKKQLIEKM